MTTLVRESRWKTGRIAVSSLLLFCSVAVPVLMVIWSATNAMSGKPFGAPANEIAYFPGALENGEMWHWVMQFSGTGNTKSRLFHLRRLNLETGVEQDTGIVATWAINPIWIGNELYAHNGSGTLFKQQGQSFVPVAQLPPNPAGEFFFVQPFPHHGRVATIRMTQEGDTELVELLNDQWSAGQKVILPKLPATDDDFDQPGAFGIRFADLQPDRQEIDPKIPPVDGPDAESIRTSLVHSHTRYSKRLTQYVMAFDREGPIISTEIPRRVARQKADGSWKRLASADDLDFLWYPLVIADPSEPVAYLFEDGNQFSSSRVRRIVGDVIQPVHLVVQGKVPEYLDRWKQIAVGLLIAWLVHLLTVIAAVSMLRPPIDDSVFRFGHRQAILAPLWRRALALAIDFAIGLSAPMLLVAHQASLLANDSTFRFEFKLCDELYDCETAISDLLEKQLTIGTALQCAKQLIDSCEMILRLMRTTLGPLESWTWVSLLVIVGICLARTYCEGRFGVTPGKWLLGIRTVRSTLRPCGFARSLLRSTLYCVDIPLLITPIPAVISMIRSPLQQRCGDQAADTVVIRVIQERSIVDNAGDGWRACYGAGQKPYP